MVIFMAIVMMVMVRMTTTMILMTPMTTTVMLTIFSRRNIGFGQQGRLLRRPDLEAVGATLRARPWGRRRGPLGGGAPACSDGRQHEAQLRRELLRLSPGSRN